MISNPVEQPFPKLDTPITAETVGTASDGSVVSVDGALIAIPWYRLLISIWNRTGGSSGGNTVATGEITLWPGDISTIPQGKLLCDGTSLEVSVYQNLFSVIGYKYGGSGSLFNLPNLADRVTLGASGGHPIGTTGGSLSVTIPETALPMITPVVVDPGHAHGEQIISGNNTGGNAGAQGGNAANDTSVGTTDPAETGISIEPFGSGDPLALPLPPYLALYHIIQT